MALYSVMCSVSGSLSSIAQKIQNEIVDVLMAFTRPVLQTTDTEEAINNSVWLLMLKELLQYTMSRPQFFLGGLSLLSELLPIPLPINTLEVGEALESIFYCNLFFMFFLPSPSKTRLSLKAKLFEISWIFSH
jgi:hypothetical protein